MNKSRILIADDHALMREGLRALLSRQPDMEVVGEAGDGAVAVKLAIRLQPDILLMDISMPNLDGVEATFQLKQVCPQTRVVVFTAHDSLAVFKQMRKAGVAGYVHKLAASADILAALRVVARGRTYFDPDLSRAARASGAADPGPMSDLSDRESQVLRLLAQGYLGKEIADKLKVSTKSVETYKTRLLVKLGINSRAELMRYAAIKFPADRP